MNVNRLLVVAAVVCFALTALSAFSDSINLNELGWLALGLTAWAASALPWGTGLGVVGGRGPARRRRVLR
jgi:hypothetical protein